MTLLRWCALFAVMSPTLWAETPTPTGPELIPNGGFEQVDADGSPTGWIGIFSRDWGDCAGTLTVVQESPAEGARCALLSGVRDTYALATRQAIAMAPDRAYLLTARVRTQLRPGQSAYLVASWRNDKGAYLSLESSSRLAGRRPWTPVMLVLSPRTRPAGAVSAQISFRVQGTAETGRAWVDAVSLRECELPAPAAWSVGERQRLLDMTRELLIETEAWRDRLAVLQRRRADLEALLRSGGTFPDLQEKYGSAATEGTFLTWAQAPRSSFDVAIPTDAAALRKRAPEMLQLPRLRAQCYAELEQMLTLKRQLDARPELRRFYLWAQLARLRSLQTPAVETPAPVAPSEFTAAAAQPPEPTGELGEIHARAELAAGASGRVTVAFRECVAEEGDRLLAGLYTPGGRLAGFAQAPAAEQALMVLLVPQATRWFPDFPYLYELRVGLFRGGKAIDWYAQKLAFRDIRVVEADVTPTMRHTAKWSMTDYTFVVNGQPWFPRGTVCSEVMGRVEEGRQIFRELWLEFHRTYGSAATGISPQHADELAAAGIQLVLSMGQDYRAIRSYVSSARGMEGYREAARRSAWVFDHPLTIAAQTGNEAELAVWGADLPAVYGDDLWHVFNETNRAFHEETDCQVPTGYVRASSFGSVLPVPRDDYSGVNQYTGRYSGRRCTITSDLGALAEAATLENKPIAITEWNGPKYSWATRGVSGVDEQGAAAYLADYWRTMLHTPTLLLSTEFVLNWVLTPLEDLTSVPLSEGLANRARWHWNNQQGVPWYPSIWPDLLSDVPTRHALAGLQSPLYDLCESPGPLQVLAVDGLQEQAAALAARLHELGRPNATAGTLTATSLAQTDANLLILGGVGAAQPPALQELSAMGVIGPTDAEFPGAGKDLIQRRVNPWFPDRVLVVVTAGDSTGMATATDRLQAAAEDLGQVYAREASRARAVALIDTDADAMARYVLELPTRAGFLGRDDIRTQLRKEEFLAVDGRLAPTWSDLRAVVVAVHRPLSEEEAALLEKLRAQGVNLIWSAATLQADPDLGKRLGVVLGAPGPLSQRLTVAPAFRTPLSVPEMGDASLTAVEKFSGIKPDTPRWQAGTMVRPLSAGSEWQPVATDAMGAAVVIQGSGAQARQFVFGVDLSAVAGALWQTTERGVLHSIYDRDTACGLERVFRVMANAMSAGAPQRPASTPRLVASVWTDRETVAPQQALRVTVQVRDAEGTPTDAAVRVSFAQGNRFLGLPGTEALWATPLRVGPGRYELTRTATDKPTGNLPVFDIWNARDRGQRCVTIFADVAAPGYVSDWTSHTVRFGDATTEPEHLERLLRFVSNDLLEARLSVNDKEKWVEVQGRLTVPGVIHAGKPAALELVISQVEGEAGNDWMENVELVLRPVGGKEAVRIPVAPGKFIAASKASPALKQPADTLVVGEKSAARFSLTWTPPHAGQWEPRLRYRYTDDFHVQDTNALPRDDPFGPAVLDVQP